MADLSSQNSSESPAIGEKRARWGYGYQDKVATARILDILRTELRTGSREFEGVRLADVQAGRIDDFVLIWKGAVQGNSIKWSSAAEPINWGDLIGSDGLIKELSDGFSRLSQGWSGKEISARLQSNRPASTERHHAQLIKTLSVSEFLNMHWADGPLNGGPVDLNEAWNRIRNHTGLSEPDFSRFIAACEIVLGFPEPPLSGPDTDDQRHYLKQFDALLKAISTWLTKNPNAEFISRQVLLEAIGYQSHRSDLIQTFPSPQIPYERNATAAERLNRLIADTAGGYLTVTGAAGVGKSTLVQDVSKEYPFFISYYAYLPDGQGNPRERGASLTFFQDVILRLDKFLASRLSIGISEVAQGRAAFRQHMLRAHELFVSDGRKTILLIDGLDHITREVGVEAPLVFELPRPEEVPDGFLIILSAQPQAFLPDTIEQHVAQAVAVGSGRRLDVTGLAREDVHAIVAKSKRPADASDRDKLFLACQGNPLVLTYLLNRFVAAPNLGTEEVINEFGKYSDNIEQYYDSAFSIPLSNATTKATLGLLCRAAPIIPTTWLQQWPERQQVEEIYQRLLAPFLREEGGLLYFIHNSLIAFLKERTRSTIPGADLAQDERNYHFTLATRCGNPTCVDPLGRAKVFHLFRAKKDRELLDLLSSEWLREAIAGFLPYSEVAYLIRLGFDSAWRLQEYGHVIRLALLNFEVAERTNRIEAGDLAETFLKLDEPDIAIRQVQFAGRVLVDDKVALRFASALWHYANDRNRTDLRETAKTIYFQAKPLGFIYGSDAIDTSRHHDFADTLRSWASAAPLFETSQKIIEEITRLRFKGQHYVGHIDPAVMKPMLLFEAFQTVLNWDGDAYKAYLDELTQVNLPFFVFEACLWRYREQPSAEQLDYLETRHATLPADEDVDLVFATVLNDAGRVEKARAIAARLNHLRCTGSENRHALGLNDVSYTALLTSVQDLLGLEAPPPPTVNEAQEEASARVETTAKKLGILLSYAKRKTPVEHFPESCRAILLFHNIPIALEHENWQGHYIIGFSKKDIYEQLIDLALRLGDSGMRVLHTELQRILDGPAGSQFAPVHRRLFAKALFDAEILGAKDAAALGLSSLPEVDDDDPIQRQRTCLDIALFLYELDKQDFAVKEWVSRASKLSAGAGSHKDYHMAELSGWLIQSIGINLNYANRTLLNDFVRALEVSGGDGGHDAATALLNWLPTVDPASAASLAKEFIDRDVLNVAHTLEGLLIGCTRAGTSPSLLAAAYSEMLSLLHPRDTSEAAVAVLRSFPLSQRISAADSLIKSVRTNALPTHRIKTARAIQDALRKDGLGDFNHIHGLKPGDEDSSWRGVLYTLDTEEVLTADQVSQRLSRMDLQGQWNPHPAANKEFNWWDAIENTQVQDRNHLEALLAAFPQPQYRKAEVLAWKSRELLRLGHRALAKEMAEQAFAHAKDGSWFTWLDGAKLRIVYGALTTFDSNAMHAARAHFGRDLADGKLSSTYLLHEIIAIFQFLQLPWPAESALDAIRDYLVDVLAANKNIPDYAIASKSGKARTSDDPLCHFLFQFLAFPVVDVGIAARRALSAYASSDGPGLVSLLREVGDKPIQLEPLLACIHVGLRGGTTKLRQCEPDISHLNTHPSIAIRAIARRICIEQGWQWHEIRDMERAPTIIIAAPSDSDVRESELLIGDDSLAFLDHCKRLLRLLMDAGSDRTELESEFRRLFRELQETFAWTDEQRFQRWKTLVLAKLWLKQSVFVGREAIMRVMGNCALSGQAPGWSEQVYDFLYPIYDPDLELFLPTERPREMVAMDWGSLGEDKQGWHQGEGAADWTNYPTSIGGMQIIGERTLFIRPDWDWPREERYRGLLLPNQSADQNRTRLASGRELTFRTYLDHDGQGEDQLVVWNRDQLLMGPSSRWIAFNSKIAERLGWIVSDEEPFQWTNAAGELMVRSVFWRDGWTDLEPPRFEALGTGWLVVATPAAMEAIRNLYGIAEHHLWVERESHGKQPYRGAWHLSSPLG